MDEEKTTNINIKQENSSSGKLGFWGILGIILVVLFVLSLVIDIREDGLRCIKLKDCKPLGTAVLTKFFLVDYHISSEVDYLKENNIVGQTITGDTIVPERAVRTDLFVNVLFYLALLILVGYLGYVIAKRGLTGALGSVLALAIYFVLVIIVTGLMIKQVYVPLTAFGKLFNYIGVII